MDDRCVKTQLCAWMAVLTHKIFNSQIYRDLFTHFESDDPELVIIMVEPCSPEARKAIDSIRGSRKLRAHVITNFENDYYQIHFQTTHNACGVDAGGVDAGGVDILYFRLQNGTYCRLEGDDDGCFEAVRELAMRYPLTKCTACYNLCLPKLRCGACWKVDHKRVYYCSKKCQIDAWSTHKPTCSFTPSVVLESDMPNTCIPP